MEGNSAFAPFFASTWLHSLRYAEVSSHEIRGRMSDYPQKGRYAGEPGCRNMGYCETFACTVDDGARWQKPLGMGEFMLVNDRLNPLLPTVGARR